MHHREVHRHTQIKRYRSHIVTFENHIKDLKLEIERYEGKIKNREEKIKENEMWLVRWHVELGGKLIQDETKEE